MPATIGTLARSGPEKRADHDRPHAPSLEEHVPLLDQLRIAVQRPHVLDLLVIVVAQPVGEPVAERRADGGGGDDGPEVQGVGGADDACRCRPACARTAGPATRTRATRRTQAGRRSPRPSWDGCARTPAPDCVVGSPRTSTPCRPRLRARASTDQPNVVNAAPYLQPVIGRTGALGRTGLCMRARRLAAPHALQRRVRISAASSLLTSAANMVAREICAGDRLLPSGPRSVLGALSASRRPCASSSQLSSFLRLRKANSRTPEACACGGGRLLHPLAVLVGQHRLQRRLALVDAFRAVVDARQARARCRRADSPEHADSQQAEAAKAAATASLARCRTAGVHRFLLRFGRGAHRRQACGRAVAIDATRRTAADCLRDSAHGSNVRPPRHPQSLQQGVTIMVHAIRVHQTGGPEVMKWESVEVPAPGPRPGAAQAACRRRQLHRRLSALGPLQDAAAVRAGLRGRRRGGGRRPRRDRLQGRRPRRLRRRASAAMPRSA